MAKQDVRHVDFHSTSNVLDSPSASPGGAGPGNSLTPVAVKVPWLAPKSRVAATTQEETRSADPAIVPGRPFQPQSFVATMGVGAEPLAVGWSLPNPAGSALDFDQVGEVGPRRSPAPQEATLSRVAFPGQPKIAPETELSPRPSQPTWLGNDGETHFRVDPPQSGNTPRSTVDSSLATNQSPWQQQLVVADQFLKDYGRLILLVAVMTAAGFLLVVLNRGGTLPVVPVDLPMDPSPANQIAPAAPEEMAPFRQLRPIDPPRVADALGPEGLAIRKALDGESPSEPDITPIKPHFESHDADPVAEPKPHDAPDDLPYPSTNLPSWEGAEQSPTEEDSANVAVIRAVRPTR